VGQTMVSSEVVVLQVVTKGSEEAVALDTNNSEEIKEATHIRVPVA